MNKWQQATTVRLSIFGYVFSEKVRNSRPEDPGVVIGPEGVRYVLGEAAIVSYLFGGQLQFAGLTPCLTPKHLRCWEDWSILPLEVVTRLALRLFSPPHTPFDTLWWV